jgi:hypothetical protein
MEEQDGAARWLRVTVDDLSLDPGPKQNVLNKYIEVQPHETVQVILRRALDGAGQRHAVAYDITAQQRTTIDMDVPIKVPISFGMTNLHYTLAMEHTNTPDQQL